MPDFSAHSLALSPLDFTALVHRYQGALSGFLCGVIAQTEQVRSAARYLSRCLVGGQAGPAPTGGESCGFRGASLALSCGFLPGDVRVASAPPHSLLIARYPESRFREVLSSPVSFEKRLAERARLRAALAQLSTRDVTCLVVHVVEGVTAIETAQIMGNSPQAIAKRIARTKQRLRTAY